MYKITETKTGTEHLSDTCIPIRLSASGSYTTPRKGETAQGFVGKVPYIYQRPVYPVGEDGAEDMSAEPIGVEDVEGYKDQPFVLPGQTMRGDEPEATYAEISAVPEIQELTHDLEQAYELLYGGDAV